MPRGGELTFGLDLGSGMSMSAIAACWAETGRLEIMAAFPSTPTLAERGLRDGVGRLYLNLLDTGDLLTLGENVVPIHDLLHAAFVRLGAPSTIVCDRWREKELLDALSIDRRGHTPHRGPRPWGSGTAAKMCGTSSAQFCPGKLSRNDPSYCVARWAKR